MTGPPATTAIRTANGLLLKDRSLSEASSSPSKRTKAPIGKSRREKVVSPFFLLSSFGPQKSENSKTLIPAAFATKKWPNSCKITMRFKAKMAIKMFILILLLAAPPRAKGLLLKSYNTLCSVNCSQHERLRVT